MPFAVPVGNGVYRIDTEYLRPGLAASHLVVDDGHAAFVDTMASIFSFSSSCDMAAWVIL